MIKMMIRLTAFLLLLGLVLSQENSSTTTPASTTSKTTPNATTTQAVKSSTSSKSTTSTSKPTTTNKTSTTTSTTTSPPDTTSTTPKPTTTSVPSTSTSPVTTTTLAPPLPPPKVWNATCILATFTSVVHLKYNATVDNKTVVRSAGFNLPNTTIVDEGKIKCNETAQSLVLSFNDNGLEGELNLTFTKSDGNVQVADVALSFNLTEKIFWNYIDPTQYGNQVTLASYGVKDNTFKVDTQHSFKCKSDVKLTLKDITPGFELEDVELHFYQVQLQAFLPKGQTSFSTERECPADIQVSDVVPIAVGAALAGLVIIVLIAYFVGRRRSRRLAYQSV